MIQEVLHIPKIMVVDDEDGIRYLMKNILEKAGHEVITVHSGEECLNILKKEKPDLVLLDVMMPGLTGYDTCKIIKADRENRSIPVAMLTVKSDDEDKLRSLEGCKAEWHITKPVDKGKLVEIIDWLLKSPVRSSMRS